MSRVSKSALLFLAVLCLYLTWTFDHSLWNPDETRDAGIAAEMERDGNYAVPMLNGEVFLEKPPLYYWTCLVVYKLTGVVSAGTTRLPSALYGVLGILFTFLLGKTLFNEQTGLLAAGMLATTIQYFRMSHFAMMDVSLAALVTAALYCHVRGSKLGFILFTVLAFYAKGFLGVLLPGLVVFIDDLIERKPKELAKTAALGVGLFALLVWPWFWALWKQGGWDYPRVFLIDNHWKRFVANGVDHTEHFWFFYFLSFPVDFLPWTFFFAGFLWSFFKDPQRYLESRPQRFIMVWFLALLAFFTLASSKRSIYLLPLFPAACLLSAGWLERQAGPILRRAAAGLCATLALLLVASSFTLAGKLDRDKTFVPVYEAVQSRRAGRDIVGFDLSEMERGVFSFYLKSSFLNVHSAEELQALLGKNPPKKIVLIMNRNKMQDVSPVLKGRAQLVFAYRPEKRSRSYLVYESAAN